MRMALGRKMLAGLVIVSIFCISVVVLIGMVQNAGCVARAVNGGACPANAFARLFFHASAFSHLTQVLVSAIVLLLGVALHEDAGNDRLIEHARVYGAPIPSSYTSYKHVIRWLALRETSPTALQ